jgi:hypothetical protein
MANAIMLNVIASEIAVSENQTHFSALFPLNWFQKQLVSLGLGLRRKGENVFSAKLFLQYLTFIESNRKKCPKLKMPKQLSEKQKNSFYGKILTN